MQKSTIARIILALLLMASYVGMDAQAQQKRPPPALQAEFDTFIARFRAALKDNDMTAVAAMTKFPILIGSELRDEAHFRKQGYRRLFTARMRDCIQKTRAVYDRDPMGNDNYSFFCGQLILIMTRTPSGFLFADTGVND